jgi:hypothetical protein
VKHCDIFLFQESHKHQAVPMQHVPESVQNIVGSCFTS